MLSTGWSAQAVIVELALAERFTIATLTKESARNVFVRLGHSGQWGVGEVSPDARWGDTPESTIEQLGRIDLSLLGSPFDLERIRELMAPSPGRCALDIALHDLAAKLAGISVAELIGVGGRPLPVTSVTIPITDVDLMVARARSLNDHPALKIKVGFDGDVHAVRAVRNTYQGAIRIDANEGWSAPEAIERLGMLEEFNVELCEQPIARGHHQELAEVTASTNIPVFADEDVSTALDVAQLQGVVDGVNLKLRKTGGIREALSAISTARATGMQLMLGCDLVSGVSATAEASLAGLVDFADIDGPLLLANDPHPGVTYDRGRMSLPLGPGLGVKVNDE